MKRIFLLVFSLAVILNTSAQTFSLESVTSYPFISELSSASSGSRIAMTVNEQGKRNIYVGEGPSFELRKLTDYPKDEGIEITGLSISADGKWLVYVRGGDHGAYDESIPRNPSSSPFAPKVQVFCIPFSGGEPVLLSDGDYPLIAPDSKRVAFIKNDEIWVAPLGAAGKAERMFYARGRSGSPRWSPDGTKMLFVSSRGDHSFVGIFHSSAEPVQWIAPSFATDQAPAWSPDGRKVVFVRRPASGGAPDSITVRRHQPWAIWTADIASGKAAPLWKAPATLSGSAPGNYNLQWAAGDRIVYMSYHDGWQHLYSLAAAGGEPLLLTKGSFMTEHIRLSADKKWLIASANTGTDREDLDRRHIIRVPVDKASMEILTPGRGIESFPVLTGDGNSLVMLSATAQRPTLPAVMEFKKGAKPRLLGEQLIPKAFPSSSLVTPKSVSFTASDGMKVYGQLFEPKTGGGKKPAIVFVHGGPERQMLVGWHYGDYYANTYALNQYLASQGFVVLAVNYRLGIGYGYEFHNPPNTGIYGAEEYLDVKAAGLWLAAQPEVDAKRIGVYGGSYGGFLTAMALARDSRIFAAGVDIHGEHNYMDLAPAVRGEQAPDAALARKKIWESSPVAWLDTWTSPVLLIHGDDDGNVAFHQSTDLVKRFEKKGFPFSSLVIPDETHHWMLYSNIVKVDEAIAGFLVQKLKTK